MPFHPQGLDEDALRRIAKNMHKRHAEALPGVEMTLSQAQELLARGLLHDDWHAAMARGGALRDKALASRSTLAIALCAPFSHPGDRAFVLRSLACGLGAQFAFSECLSQISQTLAWAGRSDLSDHIERHWRCASGACETLEAMRASFEPHAPREALALSLLGQAGLLSGRPELAFQDVLDRRADSVPAAFFSARKPLAAHPLASLDDLSLFLSALGRLLGSGVPLRDALARMAQEFRRSGCARMADHAREVWLGASPGGDCASDFYGTVIGAWSQDLLHVAPAVAARLRLDARYCGVGKALLDSAQLAADLALCESGRRGRAA